MYKLNTNTQLVTESTTIMPSKFGGWLAVNTGTTGTATVDGYPLAPGDGLDFTHIHPDVIWNAPIKIVISAGSNIRLTRFVYTHSK